MNLKGGKEDAKTFLKLFCCHTLVWYLYLFYILNGDFGDFGYFRSTDPNDMKNWVMDAGFTVLNSLVSAGIHWIIQAIIYKCKNKL